MLPAADRKWIKIEDPAVNTYYEVLKQILSYVEKEPNLKLTIDDIEKEVKTKPGTIEVNQVTDSSGGKPSDGSSGAAKGQSQKSSNGQGGKQNSNKSSKQCYYCNKSGHIKSECRKKKYDDNNKTKVSSDSSQGNKSYSNYSNNSNFKYNTSVQPSQTNVVNKTAVRCSYCNIKGHMIAECRFRQKAEYNGAGSVAVWCRYCRCAGHSIDVCKKRTYKDQVAANNANNGAPGPPGFPNLRKCYKCNNSLITLPNIVMKIFVKG